MSDTPCSQAQASKQGCFLAPDLFKDTNVKQVLPWLRQLGVKIAYKLNGQPMPSRHPDAEELMWILLHADGISLVCDDTGSLTAADTLMDRKSCSRASHHQHLN